MILILFLCLDNFRSQVKKSPLSSISSRHATPYTHPPTIPELEKYENNSKFKDQVYANTAYNEEINKKSPLLRF